MLIFVLVGIISLCVGVLGTWFWTRKEIANAEREIAERFIDGIKDGTFEVAPLIPRAWIRLSRLPKPTVQELIDEYSGDEEWKRRARTIIEKPISFPPITNIGTFDESVYRFSDGDLFHAYDVHEEKYGKRTWRTPRANEDSSTPLLRALTPKERELGKVHIDDKNI